VQGDGNAYGVQKDEGATGPGPGDVHVPAPMGDTPPAKPRRRKASKKA
jgi:hypothetical protein